MTTEYDSQWFYDRYRALGMKGADMSPDDHIERLMCFDMSRHCHVIEDAIAVHAHKIEVFKSSLPIDTKAHMLQYKK